MLMKKKEITAQPYYQPQVPAPEEEEDDDDDQMDTGWMSKVFQINNLFFYQDSSPPLNPRSPPVISGVIHEPSMIKEWLRFSKRSNKHEYINILSFSTLTKISLLRLNGIIINVLRERERKKKTEMYSRT